jgi:hypothetical protein
MSDMTPRLLKFTSLLRVPIFYFSLQRYLFLVILSYGAGSLYITDILTFLSFFYFPTGLKNVFSFSCVLSYARCSILINAVVSSDVFYGLNVVRVLSIVALLLAFAGGIVTVVSDIRAVNKAQTDAHSDDGSCGYVGCACVLRLFA